MMDEHEEHVPIVCGATKEGKEDAAPADTANCRKKIINVNYASRRWALRFLSVAVALCIYSMLKDSFMHRKQWQDGMGDSHSTPPRKPELLRIRPESENAEKISHLNTNGSTFKSIYADLVTSGFMTNFIAGGFSGAVAKTFTAPIERVKLLIQTQDANPKILSGEVCRYAGICDCFVRVASEQGLFAFWRGNLTNIVRYFPTQAFNFAFKDSIKALFPPVDKKEEFAKFFLINILSGGLAGALCLLLVYPLDYARTRLASDVGKGRGQFDGLLDCLHSTYRTGGFSGLYNGIGVSIIGIVPYRGVYFGLFDTLMGFNPYTQSGAGDDLGIFRAVTTFTCAQTAAISAAYASYPFDTVRRRLQMQSEKAPEEWIYKGPADCFVNIATKEGLSALFKGAGANALRTIGAALVLVLYSEITA